MTKPADLSANNAFSTLLNIYADQVPSKKRLTARGWEISFRPPRQRDWPHSGNLNSQREILLHAGSEALAIRALELIHAGLVLQDPSLEAAHYRFHPVRLKASSNYDPRHGHSSLSVFPACQIACKASRSKRLTYALLKFLLSTRLFSRHLMDLSPGHMRGGAVSTFPFDHVHFAYAIVVAYAVVEELGLEVRVPKNGYSVRDGVWEPAVRQDLEGRLRKAGVNLGETFSWLLRSTPTKVERKNPLPVGKKSTWAGGWIRDTEISLIDAINRASRLRSRIAAHRFSEPTASLSQYDVANVQSVARQLLLETLGFRND